MSSTPATGWYQDDHDDFDNDGDCIECGGEGFVWDCFDGLCMNAEDGCDDCTRQCPECASRKARPFTGRTEMSQQTYKGTEANDRLTGFGAADSEHDLTLIWSGEAQAWWRANQSGYTTDIFAAGVYAESDARRATNHCGPEKRIKLQSAEKMLREHLFGLSQSSAGTVFGKLVAIVPREITLEMQRAYFGVIDKNMERVETDPRFGRHSSNAEAYKAMLAAAPYGTKQPLGSE